MNTKHYESVRYIDGHPVLGQRCSVRGKQKNVRREVKLNHGREFMEIAMALDMNLFKDSPLFSTIKIPTTVRDDEEMQLKAYESLAKMTNKATSFFVSQLEDRAVENGKMLGVMRTQTVNHHYQNDSEITSIRMPVDTFCDLIDALSSKSFCRQANTSSYDANCYFRMCYMLTDNYRDRDYTMSCIEKFAMQWGLLGNHAVVDISEPNEHDLHLYYGDACDRIRERIMSAQTRGLRRCFLGRRPTKKSIFFKKSCEYVINRDDGRPPVNGHLGFLTTDDLNVYHLSSTCVSKNSKDESTIQYHVGQILAVIGDSGVNHANLRNFATSQLTSQVFLGKDILFECPITFYIR